MQETILARQIARDVAKHLGDGCGWTVDESDDYTAGVLLGPNGERLYLRIPTYGAHIGKVEVSGSYPGTYDQRYGLGYQEIRVSRTRGAEIIAREITRRFLPTYRENLAKVRERIEQDDTNGKARQVVGDELAAALGSTYDAGHETIWYSPTHDGYGDVKVNHDGTRGSVEVRGLPIELVRELVDVLARYKGGE